VAPPVGRRRGRELNRPKFVVDIGRPSHGSRSRQAAVKTRGNQKPLLDRFGVRLSAAL
jgi:hypothetical protein